MGPRTAHLDVHASRMGSPTAREPVVLFSPVPSFLGHPFFPLTRDTPQSVHCGCSLSKKEKRDPSRTEANPGRGHGVEPVGLLDTTGEPATAEQAATRPPPPCKA